MPHTHRSNRQRALLAALESPDASLRAEAATFAGGSDWRNVAPLRAALEELKISDPDPSVRVAAKEALEER